jgi:hypothetical protein
MIGHIRRDPYASVLIPIHLSELAILESTSTFIRLAPSATLGFIV